MFIDTVTGYGASVLCLCGLLMKVFETEKDGQRNGEREKEIASHIEDDALWNVAEFNNRPPKLTYRLFIFHQKHMSNMYIYNILI